MTDRYDQLLTICKASFPSISPMISLNCALIQLVTFVIFGATCLEIRRGVDRAWCVILIQRVRERAVGGCAGLLLIGIWIVEVILITAVLLLAIHPPDCDSNATEEDSTANASDHTAYNTLGCAAQA